MQLHENGDKLKDDRKQLCPDWAERMGEEREMSSPTQGMDLYKHHYQRKNSSCFVIDNAGRLLRYSII